MLTFYDNIMIKREERLKKTQPYIDFKLDFLNQFKSNVDSYGYGFPMYNPELNLLVFTHYFGAGGPFVDVCEIKPHDLERKIRNHYKYQENVLEIYKVRKKTFSMEQFEENVVLQLKHDSWENAYFWYQKNCCKLFNNNQNNICMTDKDLENLSSEELENIFTDGLYTVRFDSANRIAGAEGALLTKDEVLNALKTKTPAIIMSATEEDVLFDHYYYEKRNNSSIISSVELECRYDINVADMDWNLDTVQTRIQKLANELEESNKTYPTIQIKYLLTNLLVNRDIYNGDRLPVWFNDLKIPKQLEDIVDSIFFNKEKTLPDTFCWDNNKEEFDYEY